VEPYFSNNYLKLINNYITVENRSDVGRALYIFAYDYPQYKNTVLREIKIDENEIRITDINPEELRGQIEEFKSTLPIHSPSIFLLNDAEVFMSSKRNKQQQAIKVTRADIGIRRYFKLFNLINDSAINASSWTQFRTQYKKNFKLLIENDSYLSVLSEKMAMDLYTVKNNSDTVTVIDSGVQGTFALFVAESLENKYVNIKTDIQLFCLNPWLSNLFKDKYFTTDPNLLFGLERLAEKKSN
jgi:hypothetical protein